jgi:hypothetical protein
LKSFQRFVSYVAGDTGGDAGSSVVSAAGMTVLATEPLDSSPESSGVSNEPGMFVRRLRGVVGVAAEDDIALASDVLCCDASQAD